MFGSKKKGKNDSDDDVYIDSNNPNPTHVLIPKESNLFLAIEID